MPAPKSPDRRIRPGTSPAQRRWLRREQTDAERVLWFQLRSRPLGGFKFRRQHSLGPYVLDFYCAEARLGIELDGGQHAGPQQLPHDEVRRRYLEDRGVRVVRFWDHDLLTDPTSGQEVVRAALTLPSPTAVGEEQL